MGHGYNAAGRMCPPPRNLALEADGCFMVWVQGGPNRIQGCGAKPRAQLAGSPRLVSDVQRKSSKASPAWLRRAPWSRPSTLLRPPSAVAYGQC
jgi:hypothetical protein